MLSPSILTVAALVALSSAAPLPLNINLGAYSPALVVGDGAMSFEEANAVTNLVNSLQGAATTGAAAAAGTANGAAEGTAATPATPVAAAPATESSAAAVAAAGSSVGASEKAPILNDQTAALPIAGMGKKAAVGLRAEPVNEQPKVSKRQSGFDRALTYAEAALTKGPKVQLGTGKEGSGVGIIVDNNQQAAARVGTGAA